MSQQTPKQPVGSGEDRVKQELRGLRKIQAPWYFESRLQQALRAGTTQRLGLKRPVPAFALSLLGIALVGAAGYYFYIHADVGSPAILEEGSQPQPPASQPPVTPLPSSSHQETLPVVVPEGKDSRQQGPAESGDQNMRSTVQQRIERGPRPGEGVMTEPSDAAISPDREDRAAKPLDTSSRLQGSMTSKSPDTAVQHLRVLPENPVNGVTARRDSVKPIDTSATRKDSSKTRRDTLQRSLQQLPLK